MSSTATVPANYQQHLTRLMANVAGVQATYVWIDGLGGLRSKVKTLSKEPKSLADIPEWVYPTDLYYEPMAFCVEVRLVPVKMYNDPFTGGHHKIILCQGLAFDDANPMKPVEVNSRFPLEEILKKADQKDIVEDLLITFKQEYYLFESCNRRLPLGWSVDSWPKEVEGGYDFRVGATLVEGRDLAEAHLRLCLAAGVNITGQSAGSSLSTWNFEIGPLSVMEAADDLYMARYLLLRLGEQMKIVVSFDDALFPGLSRSNTLVEFSTKKMRTSLGECNKHLAAKTVFEKLQADEEFEKMMVEMAAKGYSWNVVRRLNKLNLKEKKKNEFEVTFKKDVSGNGYYIQDRRLPSNLDPYVVSRLLIKAVLH